MAVTCTSAAAQSLADVARAEEARRKTVKGSVKVYTNSELMGGEAPSEPAPASAADAATAGKPASPTGAAAPGKPATDAATAKPNPKAAAKQGEKEKPQEPPKDEKYWRERATALRNSLARNKVLADALQSRVNALNNDFAAMDDPVKRAAIEQNRRTALAEMDRTKQETEKLNKDLVGLEEEARKSSVPPGWLR